MKTILVSGASGIVGYGILRSLKTKGNSYRLIGTSIYDYSVAPAFCDIFERAIHTDENDYIDWLSNIIKKYSVDMIMPGLENDMIKWNNEKISLTSAGTFVALNNSDLINVCSDKWNFYEKINIKNGDIAIPTTIDAGDIHFDFPYILKPRRGYGSKGIVKVNTEKEFEEHKEKLKQGFILQPIIGTDEEEYTVSAFFDEKSVLVDSLAMKRKLSKEGFTQEAQIVDNIFVEAMLSLAITLQPVGPTNFQFRIDKNNNIKLLEINPRISSATSMRAHFGYNESVMSVNYFLDNILPSKIDQSTIINKRAIRYMEDYFPA